MFTSETARQAIVKSHEARRINTERAKNREALAAKALDLILNSDVITHAKPDDFTERRLTRIRQQIERIDAMLADSNDSKEIKELSDSLTRLAEQERQLAGRPSVGTLKPTAPNKTTSRREMPRVDPRTNPSTLNPPPG